MNSNIKWKKDSDGDIYARVGAINMRCWKQGGYGCRVEYRAFVNINHVLVKGKSGGYRLSQEKAKEDAIFLAKELLQDLDMGLTSAIETFEKKTKVEVRG